MTISIMSNSLSPEKNKADASHDLSRLPKWKIDMHTHILPKKWPSHFPGVDLELQIFAENEENQFEPQCNFVPFERPTGFVAQMQWRKGSGRAKELSADGGTKPVLFRKCRANLFDCEEVLKDCDAYGTDLQVLSTVPVMFNYQLAPTIGAEWSKFLNQDMGRVCKTCSQPGRLAGLGTLPLQHPELAAKEAERAVLEDGLKGFQIGSHVNMPNGEKNMYLYDKRLDCVWQTLERLGAPLLVHPWDMEYIDSKYWLPWLVGMPAEMSLSMCHIMLSGVMDRFRNLKWMFSHGGGAVPGTLGRIEWGYRCRPDLVGLDSAKTNPREAFKRLYLDSITHDENMLQHVIRNLTTADKVALGSDYPFPLGEVPSVAPGTVDALSGAILDTYPGEMVETTPFLSDSEREQILYKTGLEFLNMREQELVKHDRTKGFRCTDRFTYM
ncbi:unnamed protein product [Amoebophrya sp. A120]|nr:unnamed protein product [Amoebophrya sp. A120]|eukprot:GSA120T00010349001.1